MSFNLSSVAQSQKFFCDIKSDMYDNANDLAKTSGLMRASGPLLAAGSAFINTIGRVATVGETLIKGLANVFGSPVSENCSLLKGFKQLFIQLPLHITALAFTPIQAVFGGLEITLGMAISPDGYSEYQHKRYLEKSAEFEALVTKKPVKVALPYSSCGGRAFTLIAKPECHSLKSIMYA